MKVAPHTKGTNNLAPVPGPSGEQEDILSDPNTSTKTFSIRTWAFILRIQYSTALMIQMGKLTSVRVRSLFNSIPIMTSSMDKQA